MHFPNLWQLAIVLLIVVLIFGTKRLKSVASDLGGAIKGFKKSMADDEAKAGEDPQKRLESDDDDDDDADFPERKKNKSRSA
jgi:sec-independent protein translocase protein TatA